MQKKPTMKFFATNQNKLDSIPCKEGQMIFVIDQRTIYLDISDYERTTYQAIISIVDEKTRRQMSSPIEGFYYVRKENNL